MPIQKSLLYIPDVNRTKQININSIRTSKVVENS